MLFLLASCLPETLDPPYGVWLSEEPRIMLYIKPEYRISVGTPSYFGFYTVNDVETKIFAQFGAGFRFAIYDLTKPREIGVASGVSHLGTLLVGTYRVAGEEIRYTLTSHFQEQLGVNTITFHRVEDYYLIDPDWVSNFVSRPD